MCWLLSIMRCDDCWWNCSSRWNTPENQIHLDCTHCDISVFVCSLFATCLLLLFTGLSWDIIKGCSKHISCSWRVSKTRMLVNNYINYTSAGLPFLLSCLHAHELFFHFCLTFLLYFSAIGAVNSTYLKSLTTN